MKIQPVFRTLKPLALCMVSSLLFINLLFLLKIIDIVRMISIIEPAVSPDNRIENPYSHLLVIQGLLGLCFLLLLFQIKKEKDTKIPLPNRCALCISIALLFLAIIYRHDAYTEAGLYKEDSILEHMTALLLIASSFLFLILSFKAGRKERARTTVLILLFFSAFFIGMEEISWGQRILGLKTPEGLSRINQKQELNFHNILQDPIDDIIYYSF